MQYIEYSKICCVCAKYTNHDFAQRLAWHVEAHRRTQHLAWHVEAQKSTAYNGGALYRQRSADDSAGRLPQTSL